MPPAALDGSEGSTLLPFERLVIAYLAFFVLAAPFTTVDRRRRTRTVLTAASSAVAVYGASRVLPLEARLWLLPFLYIALGYWIPVPLVPSRRGGAFEAWLVRSDEAFRRNAGSAPRWLTYTMELGYLACFPLIPVAFAVVWIAGTPSDVARFWTAVIAAGYACYITLPWLVSRPPRLIDERGVRAATTSVARANVFVLGTVSHHLNTFPSGHVAVSFAAALSAGTVWPLAGVLLSTIAAGVALGAVAGRYHFIADVVIGVGIGVLASYS